MIVWPERVSPDFAEEPMMKQWLIRFGQWLANLLDKEQDQ
jgi:hypothetical protein